MATISFNTPTPPDPVATIHRWGLTDTGDPVIPDPVVATERMWWADTGILACPAGAAYSKADTGRLVGDADHRRRLSGQPAEVETRPAPPVEGRRKPGRPRKARPADTDDADDE